MISILIPIYNFDCRALIEGLHKQILTSGTECEILVANDASTTCTEAIEEISRLDYIKYFSFDENQGRSKIRNFLASKAAFQYLLFLDCDAEICNDNYLKRYIGLCHKGVCCSGGIAKYPYEEKPEYSLNLMYNHKVETNYIKNKVFTTFNFLIDKDIFNQVKFNDTLSGYGHEDTIFASDIQKITPIEFVENNLVHLQLSKNEEYLKKIEESCEQMCRMARVMSDDEMKRCFRVWRAFSVERSLKTAGMAASRFQKQRERLRRQLFSLRPSIIVLHLYKLGYTCYLMRSNPL